MESLFGLVYSLTKIKDLSQPGQYACKETLTVCGPKGAIENIRIQRGGILHNTIVRANDESCLECHLDIEEANALGVISSSKVVIKK